MTTRQAKTYPSGEPKDRTLMVIGIVLMVLIVGWMIWFISDGYAGALFGLILMLVRVGFFLAILVGLGMMVVGLFTRRQVLMRVGLVMFLVGLIGFFLLGLLALIF
jgi:hypothetical protein